MILRFFIVVGFLLSVIAAAGSFSIYQSYQAEREQRLEAESKAMQLQDTVTAVKADFEQQKSRTADLEGQIAVLQKAEKDLQSQQSAKESEIETLKSNLAAKSEELSQLQIQIENYRKKEQVPAPVIRTSSTMTSTTQPALGNITTAISDVSPAATVSTTQTPVTSTSVSTTPSAPAVIPAEAPASDDSRILTVNRKFNFIVVNIGLRDGLRMGDKVQVMQGSSQKALAQIEKIYDKFSAATLLNEDKGNPVHEGDAVHKV